MCMARNCQNIYVLNGALSIVAMQIVWDPHEYLYAFVEINRVPLREKYGWVVEGRVSSVCAVPVLFGALEVGRAHAKATMAL